MPRAMTPGGDCAAEAEAEADACWLRWLPLVGLTLVPWLAWPRGPSLEGHHLFREAALASLALLALVGGARRRRAHDALDVSVLAFALVSVLAAALAVDPWTGLRLAGLTCAAAVVFVAGRDLDATLRRRVLGFAAAALATWAVGESLGLWPTLGTAHGRAPCGPLATRNELAHVLALALASWLSADVPKARRWRALESVALALLAAGVVVTRSRAAWVSTLAAALVAGVLMCRVVWPRLLAALAGATGAVLLPTHLAWRSAHPFFDSWRTLLDAITGSGAGRVQQALTSMRLLRDAPVLGVGPGHWAVHYPRVAAPTDPTVAFDSLEPVSRLLTCDAVAVWVERGVLGGLLAVATAAAAWSAWRSAEVSRAVRAGTVAGGVALVGLVVLDSVLAVAATLAPVVVALAPPRPGVSVVGASKRWWTGAMAVTLVAVVGARAADLVALTWRTGRRASLERLERAAAVSPGDYLARAQLAEAHVLRGSCVAARPWLDAALKLRPYVRYLAQARDACRASSPAAGGIR